MRLTTLLLLPVLCLVISACSGINNIHSATKAQINHLNENLISHKEKLKSQLKNTRIIDDFYVPPLSKDALTKPSWWYNVIPLINSFEQPVEEMMQQLASEFGVKYQFTRADLAQQKVTIKYSGEIGGLVEQLSVLTNQHFVIRNNILVWHENETRIFDISFMPGSSHYYLGDTSNVSAVSEQSDSTTSTTPQSVELSNLAMTSNVWDDLHTSLTSMLSNNASMSVSPSTSMLTVQDAPWRLDNVARYIKRLNSKLSQQIYIDVQVIEVSLNDGMDYGINWNIVKQAMSAGGNIAFSGNIANSTINNLAPATITATITDSASQYAESSLLVSALEQQGEVSVVSSPRVVTLNNQMAEISITEQITYLASSSSRTTANVGAETILTPGVVETGIQLYVQPLLSGDEVMLQIFGTFSTLQDITTVESNNSLIQAPNIRNRRIMQKAKVPLGDTLMLAGFRNTQYQTRSSGLFGQPWLNGNRSVNHQDTEVLILLSPHVIPQRQTKAG